VDLEELESLSLDDVPRSQIIKAPFGWPGGKSKSLDYILPRLPYRERYVEVFGGSGAVLLARRPCKCEVFNDAYSGVTDFYRTLQSDRYTDLVGWIQSTLHGRELFNHYRDTWADIKDPFERACRWFYMVKASFSGLGRQYGRSLTNNAFVNKLYNCLGDLAGVHERLKGVCIENADWRKILQDYDSPQTVFYLDPPYVDAYSGTYQNELTIQDHKELIATISRLQGFVAVSGYSNPLYEAVDWDARYEWDVKVWIDGGASTASNNKEHLDANRSKSTTKEVLWVKA
jgi:DNA adenine methylase